MTIYIPYEVYPGAVNMRVDAELLEKAIETNLREPIFRLYGWAPACVSLGRNQKADFLDKKFLEENNIDVVRRLTGGRALLHDDEITYSYICHADVLKEGHNVTSSYKEISGILIDKFQKLGITLEFGSEKKVRTKFDYCMLISTGADLCFKGKKLIGSAQFRKNGYILQHGSILFDYNDKLLHKIFDEEIDSSITCVKNIKQELTKEKIISVLSEF